MGVERLVNVQKTVLIAEDDSTIKEIYDRFLSQRLGLNVIAVEDGKIAYDTAVEKVPDLIITDLMMPSMTGFDLVYMIRDNPRTAKVPIIVLSAIHQKSKIVELAKMGIADYLVKPASLKSLGDKVTKLLKLEA